MDASKSSTSRNASLPFIDLKAQQRRLGDVVDHAIAQVVEHGKFIMGPEVAVLEAELAAFCGAHHAVTCANGTDALVLAFMAENIGCGDAVITPAFTFIATAQAAANRRATPIFADVDPQSFNLDPESAARAVDAARRAGLRPRALVAVDLFGLPADYQALRALADAEGLILIADAAQSFGAEADGVRVGAMKADYTTTSFFPAKPLGCYGDGGALFTQSDAAAAALRSLRVHGQGQDKYDNVRVGLNSRLDTLQAAILLEKLKIFPDEIATRNVAADRYDAALAGVAKTPARIPGRRSVWAQYTLTLEIGADRHAIQKICGDRGVPTMVYYRTPLHRQTAYRDCPCDPNGLAWSERLAEHVLSLPMHGYLDAPTQDRVVEALDAAVKAMPVAA